MLNRLVNLNIFFLKVFSILSFLFVFIDFKLRKNKKMRLIGLMLFLICVGLVLVFNNVEYMLLVAEFLLCMLLFENSIKRAIVSNIFSLLYISIIETVIGHVTIVYLKVKYPYKEIINSLCIIGIIWIYFILAPKHIKKGGLSASNKVYLCLIPVQVGVGLFLSYFSEVIKFITETALINMGSLFLVFGGLTIGVGLAFLLYNIKDKQVYMEESNLLKRYKEQQKKYYELLLSKEQDTRRFRHDIKSQLINIKHYINDAEIKELKEYIEDIYQDIEVIDDNHYNVGNEVINVMLNYYLRPINNECNIKVKGMIKEVVAVSDKDLCILISNMLTNAIEAVKKLDRSKRFIEFEVSDGILLAITVRNSYKNINKKNGLFYSTKEDDTLHGFGIQNMKNIVEKYNGNIVLNGDNGVFVTEIKMI